VNTVAILTYRSADGIEWRVGVRLPTNSNAMIVFAHPASFRTGRMDRYAWLNSHSAKAHDPRSRLDSATVAKGLTEAEVAALFRRSMPVHTDRPSFN
jgi:hypothetical protein